MIVFNIVLWPKWAGWWAKNYKCGSLLILYRFSYFCDCLVQVGVCEAGGRGGVGGLGYASAFVWKRIRRAAEFAQNNCQIVQKQDRMRQLTSRTNRLPRKRWPKLTTQCHVASSPSHSLLCHTWNPFTALYFARQESGFSGLVLLMTRFLFFPC